MTFERLFMTHVCFEACLGDYFYIAEREPKAKNAKPEQFVDFSFIKELDQSGFIDSLYRKK